MGLWYNPQLVLGYLETKGCTQDVFKIVLQALPTLKSDLEKKRVLLGLASIIKIDPYKLPAVLYNCSFE